MRVAAKECDIDSLRQVRVAVTRAENLASDASGYAQFLAQFAS